MVILLMFLVNLAGTDPAFPSWFPHRGWADGQMGLGLADIVFPWFLFVVGVSVPLSMRSGRGAFRSPLARLGLAARRALTLYLLGTLLWCATIAYNPATPITWRVLLHWDILPLIALGYLLAVALDLLSWRAHVAFALSVLAFKWISLRLAVHPDTGAVVWEQHRSFDHVIKERLAWAGVMITQGLPAAATCTLGALASHALLRSSPSPRRALHLAIVGLALALFALFAHATRFMPLSKDFLTSSYVLFSAGTGAILLAGLWFVVDHRRWTLATPLRVVGMNAIALYLIAELAWKMVLMRWQVVTPDGSASAAFVAGKAWLQHALGRDAGAWASVALLIGAYGLLASFFHRKRLFFRV
jgi:predicted acyltransferase